MSDTPPFRTAIVSGTDADAVADALRSVVGAITAVESVDDLVEAVGPMEAGSVDLYVQLPVRIASTGANAVEVVRNFLADGLIRRFDAVSTILRVLAPTSTVALVTGNHPEASIAPDNPEARLALMKVLGHTLLLERGASGVEGGRVDVKIISGVPDPGRLVELIREPQEHPVRVVSDLVAAEPSLDYSEWRDAIMSLDETRA